MKKKIKVLHIASFVGNIGDNANHKGAQRLRDYFLDFEFEITKKEIREFYWKEWYFNSNEFIDESNQYDLIMIGGGNYFELWVKDSATGTSVDISIETLKKIKTPILFYSLGCDLGNGVPDENIYKFKCFLDYVLNNNRYFISVRNDGALSNIISLYGDKYIKNISEIPDGGFFTSVCDIEHCEIEKEKKNIIINVAGDMIDVRFPNIPGNISYEEFNKKIAKIIEDISKRFENNINFIFVPHIFKDLQSIYDIMVEITDKTRRNYIKVAPYLIGDKGHDYIFSLYNQSDLILGMRFHSNVCGYALKKNVIGLSNYVQITNLYKNIQSDEYIEVNKNDFQIKLEAKIINHLYNKEKYINISDDIVKKLKSKVSVEYKKINKWLNKNLGGDINE